MGLVSWRSCWSAHLSPSIHPCEFLSDRLSLSLINSKDVAASGLPEYALDNLCNVDGFPVARVQSDTSDLFPGMTMLNPPCLLLSSA